MGSLQVVHLTVYVLQVAWPHVFGSVNPVQGALLLICSWCRLFRVLEKLIHDLPCFIDEYKLGSSSTQRKWDMGL
jgi:hypothetical protein